MKPIFFSLIILFSFVQQVKAQGSNDKPAWEEFGMPRSKVVDMKKLKKVKYIKITSNDEKSLCYRFVIQGIKTGYCYFFKNDKLSEFWILEEDKSLKEILKLCIMRENRNWRPSAYFADFTKVNTFRQALLLSDNSSKIIFENKKLKAILKIDIDKGEGPNLYYITQRFMPAKEEK